MKHIFTFVLLLAMVVSPSMVVHAEESTDTPPRTERFQEFRARQLENREKFRDTVQGMRDARRDLRRSILAAFEAHITKFERASARLETHVANFEERGVDVGEAYTHIEDANESIASAKEILAEAKTYAETNLDDETKEEDKAALKSMFEEAKEHLMAARDSLRAALAELREGIVAFRGGQDDDTLENQDDESTEEETEEENGDDNTEDDTTESETEA